MNFKPKNYNGQGIILNGLSEATTDGVDKEYKRIHDLGQVILKCPSCNIDLVVIQITNNSNNVNKYFAKCFCGDTSFPKEIKGEVYIDAANELHLADMEYDEKNNKVTIGVTYGKK